MSTKIKPILLGIEGEYIKNNFLLIRETPRLTVHHFEDGFRIYVNYDLLNPIAVDALAATAICLDILATSGGNNATKDDTPRPEV